MNKQRSVTRREAMVVLAAAVGILALTCVPYLVAAQPGYAGPGLHFAGFIWGVDDGNVYLSQIRQYSEGRLFAYDQFTTLPQTPRYLNLLWLTLGQLHRLTGWPLVTLYHLGRVVGGVLLLYAIYLLAAEMGLARRGRVLAFLLAAFSSGLGWIVYLAVVSGHLSQDQGAALSPVDIAAGWQAMPEALVPLTLLLNPLFAAGIALMTATFLWGLRAGRQAGLGAAAMCGVCLLLLGNVHTYDVLTVCPLLGLWFLLLAIRRQLTWASAAGRYALILALGLPTTLWQYLLLRSDPTWAAKAATPTPSPAVTGYLLGYGLVLGAAILGIFLLCRTSCRTAGVEKETPERLSPLARPHDASPGTLAPIYLAVLWLVLGLLAVYAPLAFQRKLVEGLHVPICLLAAVALTGWAQRLTRSSFTLLALGAIVVTLPSNVYFASDCLLHMRANNRDLVWALLPPAYVTEDERAALAWLGEHTSESDVVMCSSLMGNHVPAAAPCRVIAGHWGETVNFRRLLAQVTRFYNPALPAELRWGLLRYLGATLVIYGPEERLLQGLPLNSTSDELDPARALPHLTPAFQQGTVTIYTTRQLPGSSKELLLAPRRQ